MKSKLFLFLLFLAGFFGAAAQKSATRPNIILIMADDLGYSDIGAYGSEIQTPNLDRLATGGLRLREFYNNSICAPTRASLLTGQYQHKAGVGFFNVNLGLPAYQGYLNQQSLTIAEVLRNAGYSTLMSGKWHVGDDSLRWPNQRGFDHFYGFIGGASNYYDISPFPEKVPPVELVKDNKKLRLQPGQYLTDEITGNAIGFLDEQAKTNKPFFLYLAYNAPHWPLQAPEEVIKKYEGKYDLGWDSLRTTRLARQIELGLVPPGQTTSLRDSLVPEWSNLSYDDKKLWKRKMEVYAAMVDQMDQDIGKVMDKLKELKQDENTLVIFISDNGAQGGYSATGRRKPQRNSGPLGTAGSYGYQEQSWAYLSNTPLSNYKNNMHEGGISAPFIAWYPKAIKGGGIAKGTAHLIDLAPTFYELAGASYPKQYKGVTPHALAGKSLVPVLLGKEGEVARNEPLFWERAGNRAVRKGKWKIVSIYPAYKWELYDLETDRGETADLAARFPDVVNELSADYFRWAEKTGVVEYEKIKPKGGFAIPGADRVANAN